MKIKEIEKEIENNSITKEDLLIKIKFLQHERLIHFLVTFFTGLSTIMFLLGSLYIENIFLLILFLITLLLFIPYIFYYYYLENSIHKLYLIYFTLKEK